MVINMCWAKKKQPQRLVWLNERSVLWKANVNDRVLTSCLRWSEFVLFFLCTFLYSDLLKGVYANARSFWLLSICASSSIRLSTNPPHRLMLSSVKCQFLRECSFTYGNVCSWESVPLIREMPAVTGRGLHACTKFR